MHYGLADKTYIVTGAAGGLGTEICRTLAECGANVVAVDVQGSGVLHADVGSAEGVKSMIGSAVAEHGRLDGLVLNATVQHLDAFPDFPEEAWDRVMDVNLKGPFLAIREAWPLLTDEPGKRVVITGSASGWVAESRKVAYIAAKTAVLGLVRAACAEAAPFELTINGVAPGLMDTPLVRRQLIANSKRRGVPVEELEREWVGGHAIQRYVGTDEVARTIRFLLSPDSSGITGQVIPVDLGFLAVE